MEELRTRIASLRQRLRQALAAKKEHVRAIAATVRAERITLRGRLREGRKRVLLELRAKAHAELEAARQDWQRRKREAKSETNDLARSRAELAAARAQERALRQIKHAHRADVVAHARGATRSQTDEEVRALIPRELVPMFDRVKDSVRARAGHTRAEAFLHYAERHPEEAYKLVEPLGEQRIQRTRDELEEATRNAASGAPPAARRASPSPIPRRGTTTEASVACGCAHPDAGEAASKDAIRVAHEKIRKQRRALESQERRFERGDYGKATGAEMWHRMAAAGEQMRLAEQAVLASEGAFHAKYGHPCWEVAS
jgi:hypothetical protein